MSHWKIIVIYTNGEVTNIDEGVTFICNEVVTMIVDREITMKRLKQAITRKIQLGPN